MTPTYEMGDASTPPAPPAKLPVFAFYIGGQTPHRWTDTEYEALTSRWVLPIYTRTDSVMPAAVVADEIMSWLRSHSFDHGCTVALDTESALLGQWLADVDNIVTAGGHRLMEYESKGPIGHNPPTSGGRWVADWTGIPHLYAGSLATQYSSADMAGLAWDSSLIDQTVPLHELHKPARHEIRPLVIEADVPELSRGDHGQAVRRLQHLILAWDASELPQFGPDGNYGPETRHAVAVFQRMYGITADPGTADAETWHRLISG